MSDNNPPTPRCGHELPWREDCDACIEDRQIVQLAAVRRTLRGTESLTKRQEAVR